MKKMNKTSLATVIGAAVVSSFASSANAESNPFVMNELSSGYMQLAVADTAATPMPAAKTTTPAVAKPATKTGGTCAEGKCGEMMKAAAAAPAAKTEEGKCGEAKCGAMMQDGKMKAGMEMMCGAMMKGKEGSCGDMAGKPAAAPAPAAPAKAAEASAHSMMDGDKMKAGMEMMCGAMMKGKEGACGDMVAPAAAPAPVAVAAPAPAKAAAPAKPAAAPKKPAAPAPAAAPAKATANKVVEGQCAAVKEETHDAQKHEVNKANAPWGNRKKIVNP